jgi:hypothetical protein
VPAEIHDGHRAVHAGRRGSHGQCGTCRIWRSRRTSLAPRRRSSSRWPEKERGPAARNGTRGPSMIPPAVPPDDGQHRGRPSRRRSHRVPRRTGLRPIAPEIAVPRARRYRRSPKSPVRGPRTSVPPRTTRAQP